MHVYMHDVYTTLLNHSPSTVRMNVPVVGLLVTMYSELSAALTDAVHVYRPASPRASGVMATAMLLGSGKVVLALLPSEPGPVRALLIDINVSTPVSSLVTSQLMARPVVPS